MKKTEKHRGSRTHGRGKKAGRGAGKRGGRGNAGLLKHKFNWVVKYDPDHFGRKGFKRDPSLVEETVIVNVGDLQSNLARFLEAGIATREGKKLEVDLEKAGVSKLLGAGSIKTPMTIIVPTATARAIQKVEKVGGTVELTDEGEDFAFEEQPEE
jgi:large subunit ribosomal protein L15